MGENAAIKQRLLCALMVEAGKVIELVHDMPGVNDDVSCSRIARDRDDARGYVLYQQRNAAAHARVEAEGTPQIEFLHVQSLLAGVTAWLLETPPMSNTAADYKRGKLEIGGAATFQQLNGNGTFASAPR